MASVSIFVVPGDDRAGEGAAEEEGAEEEGDADDGVVSATEAATDGEDGAAEGRDEADATPIPTAETAVSAAMPAAYMRDLRLCTRRGCPMLLGGACEPRS
jgi:hypothetical protein